MIPRLVATLLVCSCAAAQAPDTDRVQVLERQLAAQRRQLRDWSGLIRYGSENTTLGPPRPGESRVVFIGDQLTELWGSGDAPFFPGKPYLNRGIGGQTTAQMLGRFRQDVISLHPKVVVIQGGANDLAGVSGPATEEMIAENFMSMAELARVHGIRVVIASLTPVCECAAALTRKRSQEIRQEKIVEVNELLKEYATQSKGVFLNYYSALESGQELKPEFTADGSLPNDAGYRIMAPLAEKAIAEALRRQQKELQ